ncbi:hypothetical protein [Thioalkalivibrio sp. XN279]|uniref:hypothetical protein n=1 Tax=Thioalkalivibrio sp. XN279 TaxID=2714953 RepID=UPI00140C5FEC|nr:hypothetical protein [Thioalkalivibrio sp. XN279]NHA15564.1 hypothetical protein [Thioalkalivibrio sp. XN279]
MPIFVDRDGEFHHDHGQHFALTCACCGVFSHMTPIAVPNYGELMRHKPPETGLVFRCDNCNAPVFLRFPVKAYTEEQVELSSNFSEVERPKESFDFTYLPEELELLFREALECYSMNALNAFASMCRRAIQFVFKDLGETGKIRIFEQCNEIRTLAEVEGTTFNTVRRVLFDTDAAREGMPLVSAIDAGVLMEFMRDILYESYVRKGRLQQAMMMRRYVAEQSDEAGDDRSETPRRNGSSG